MANSTLDDAAFAMAIREMKAAEQAALARAVRTFSPAALSDPATNLGLSDFCDPRAFAVPNAYSDRNTPVMGPDDLYAHQSHDGPRYITVGASVTDERLTRNLDKLHQHYGVTLEQLQAARAGQVVMVRDVSGGAT